MAKIFNALGTTLLVIAALVIAAVAAHREWRARNTGAVVALRAGPPTFVADWQRFAAVGRWVGDSSAKVRIVEFADFECPFCRRFHDVFAGVRDSVGKDVALLLVQDPLSIHRFAKPAALAAECAEKQGQWVAFQDRLFAKQDSFGLKSWTSYAREAGIRDTTSFAACVANTTRSARLEAGVAAAQQINVLGTPTVLIDGWRYAVAPYDSLTAIVRRRLRAVR
ncbi:MAG TPA: thioredoxin domain-containing protein [Acidobacteriaceae bacterium]|nr:thioredoxin domain-containing protein [Acidobacteriaceae bacterium]